MSNWNSNNYYFNQEQQFNEQQRHQLYANNSDENYVNLSESTYNSSLYRNDQNLLRSNTTAADNLAARAGPSSLNNEVSKSIDIRHSNLTPTAAEFTPRNMNFTATGSNESNGTIKKKHQNYQNKRPNFTKFSQGYSRSNQNQIESIELKEEGVGNMSKVYLSSRRDHKNYSAKASSNRKPLENPRESKEISYKNKYDHYVNYNVNMDPKKKWNRNSHYKYNRKYDEENFKGSISKENWRQSSSNTSDTNKGKNTKRVQLDLKCKYIQNF